MPSLDIVKNIPPKMSLALFDFLKEDGRLFSFLEVQKFFLSADRILPKNWEKAHNSSSGPIIIFKTHEEVDTFTCCLSEMLYSSGVNNFLSYLTDLLLIIFTTNPKTLKSNETVSLAEIFEFSEFEDLHRFLADRRVYKLSFGGIANLDRYFKDAFKIPVFHNKAALTRGMSIIESRNLIVHHQAKINRAFLMRTRGHEKTGTRLGIPHDKLVSDLDFLAETAFKLDSLLTEKLRLPIQNTRLFLGDKDTADIDAELSSDGFQRTGREFNFRFPSTPRRRKGKKP